MSDEQKPEQSEEEAKLTPLQRVKMQQEKLRQDRGGNSGSSKSGGAGGPSDGNKRVTLNRRSGGA